MKKILIPLVPLLLVACSSPKYTYYFDHYNYLEGKKNSGIESNTPLVPPIDNQLLSADAGVTSPPVEYVEDATPEVSLTASSNERANPTGKMSREERKELRKEFKKTVKDFKQGLQKDKLNPDHEAVMDHDLKLAIIFGAVGLTLSLFAGVNSAFWVLGVIAIVVGVVFLVRWLVRQ